VGAVALWLAVLSVYDIRQRRLPNWLTLPGALVILGGAVVGGRGWPALAGGAALAALYLVVHVASPAAMGAGDVKFALGVGALTGAFGPATWLLAALAAQVLTVAWGISVFLWRGERTVPHGPAMAAAAAGAVVLAAF